MMRILDYRSAHPKSYRPSLRSRMGDAAWTSMECGIIALTAGIAWCTIIIVITLTNSAYSMAVADTLLLLLFVVVVSGGFGVLKALSGLSDKTRRKYLWRAFWFCISVLIAVPAGGWLIAKMLFTPGGHGAPGGF